MDMKKFGFNDVMLRKRQDLIDNGVNPYPYSFPNIQKIDEILSVFETIDDEELTENKVVTTGRIIARRKMGKSVFMDLKDQTGKIQLYLQESSLEEEWKTIMLTDIGDIIGVKGKLFISKKGEPSIHVSCFEILSKAVVSIPFGKETKEATYYRSSDPETRYRERYISWLIDDQDFERMKSRSLIISAIRNHMERLGFLEVTTPTVEFVYGGAEARPFETSVWALGSKKVFLRISPELSLKKYIVAGFDKVFTICQNFRNEGIDISHNPEFSMMEWYESFTDYKKQMERFENLVSDICVQITGSTKINYQGEDIDFTTPWRRMTVLDAIEEFASIHAQKMSIEEIKLELDKHGIEYDDDISWGVGVVELFENLCENKLIQPIFIIDHPKEISPLTKIKRGDTRLVERFEPYVYGMELGNAYSELTDPVDQVQRFVEQREKGKGGQEYDDHPLDADFIKAIGCGMPPTGGVGIGVDRLIMLLTDSRSIREIIPFPMIKPIQNN
ncbi:lysine--tRNA ligase [Desulfobacter latus]|uniref:Lysine--tRNA ligase n=1 Tax=Desulfobacter latus TaxID=2292 RepID=A0A850TA21_9BACT|nr:lysine--tRNA ligase [Desulfobacter latus]NWH06175.1 lysine--tRNA ligase [Desulfobacter latus]